jgi:hypothetical protein
VILFMLSSGDGLMLAMPFEFGVARY